MKVEEIVHRKVLCEKRKNGNFIYFNSYFNSLFLSIRRIRDRQIQDRIREITGKMIKRRNGVRGNALEEKRQAELELREVKFFYLFLFLSF